MGAVELEAVLDELYALVPDAFLPRRAELAAQARAEGDRELANEIRRLRKPSVAAWAVNRMVQTRATDVASLTDLAGRLRSAQQSLDGALLQQLGRERSKLVDVLVKATTEAASEDGATLSAAAARDAADTFVAALASPDATAAVVSGRLTRTLTYAGFGDVDLTEATARPLRAVPDTTSSAESERAVDTEPSTKPDPEIAKAEARLKTAVAAATETAQKRSVIAAELELAENRVAQLSRELARARAHRDATADQLGGAEVADEQAQAEVQAARVTLEDRRSP